jgi:ACS family glucarate transporter-like MFS transporter
MVGNLGAAVSAVAFPFFVANITIPGIAETPGTANSFFLFAAGMNLLAVVAWMFMNPLRELKEISARALKTRLVLFLMLFVLVICALIYTNLLLKKDEKKSTSVIDRGHHIVEVIS